MTAPALRSYLGVSPEAASVLWALYAAGGEWLPRQDLIARLGLRRRMAGRCVRELRAAMDPGAIDYSAAHDAWRITESGLDECETAIFSAKAAA